MARVWRSAALASALRAEATRASASRRSKAAFGGVKPGDQIALLQPIAGLCHLFDDGSGAVGGGDSDDFGGDSAAHGKQGVIHRHAADGFDGDGANGGTALLGWIAPFGATFADEIGVKKQGPNGEDRGHG